MPDLTTRPGHSVTSGVTIDSASDVVIFEVETDSGSQTVYLPIDRARKVARDIETNVRCILIASGVLHV